MKKAMETIIDKAAFSTLLSKAKDSTEEAIARGPLVRRASKKVEEALKDTLAKTANAAGVVAQKVKINFKVFQDHDSSKLDQETPDKALHSAFNWLVELFRDIIDKINDQGEILAFIVTKLGEILDNHASKDLLKEKRGT